MGTLFLRAYYIVNFIDAVLFGIALALYYSVAMAVHHLHPRTRSDKFLFLFSTVLIILSTMMWIPQTYFGERMFVVHADYPGGIQVYWTLNQGVWYHILGTTACIMSNLMSDALLAYRCYVVWNGIRAVIIPALLWIVSFASGIGILYGYGRPGGSYFHGIAPSFVNTYTASTFAFNVIVTGLICYRIVSAWLALCRAGVSNDEDARTYTSAMAIIVESALPFTIVSFTYLVAYAVDAEIAYVFSFYIMFTVISPLMIAHRVFQRRAWTRSSGSLCSASVACQRGGASSVFPSDPTHSTTLSRPAAAHPYPYGHSFEIVALEKKPGRGRSPTPRALQPSPADENRTTVVSFGSSRLTDTGTETEGEGQKVAEFEIS
ncbi:uncharacterized protein BXZ73DRAFT_40076 [Epithele typhae]|uniref:uncharacterized protein n=1 Tax=Epithele typhae TaxID=378194 RepID=UPI002007B780|nr:uncharacterized protein BXZ73DRAFT_40076 [Epithele typhae]KAH9943351.1 hypothetical protein BXZ73DRAFT_40076 [Epithele typhae]